jgi:hypothetical protein
MWVMWNLVSDRLEIVLIFTQVGVRFCDERAISLEIVLDAPNSSPR